MGYCIEAVTCVERYVVSREKKKKEEKKERKKKMHRKVNERVRFLGTCIVTFVNGY